MATEAKIKRDSTIADFLVSVYEENHSHIDFMESMNGGDCDCQLHKCVNFIFEYLGEKEDIYE